MKLATFLSALLILLSAPVFADCPQLYPKGQTINVPNTIELCNSVFVTRYNDKTKAVVFSAEILQPTGHQAVRINDFHADKRTQSKVTPAMYSGTGWDRGHMVPADDATNATEMNETFLMTNLSPQRPTLNRDAWCHLEENVRKMVAATRKPVHVITIAVYAATPALMNGIPIPTGYFKLVYFDAGTKVYYAANVDHAPVTESTVAVLESKVGFSIH